MQIINDGKINSITLSITPKKVKQPRTPEEEIIQNILDRLNFERGKQYKPLSFPFIRRWLKESQVSTREQLYDFYRKCETSKIGFSVYFWWSTKKKNK